MISKTTAPSPAKLLRKLAFYCGIGLFVCYILGVAGIYSWFRYGRKNDQVLLADVALIRVGGIRRGIAAQHFNDAQKQWDEKKYQAAFLYFSAAVRQDPDNIPGRLAAAKFLRSVGAGNMALIMLEEGLALAPDDTRLIEANFDFLLAAGRDRRALELLKLRYPSGLTGRNAALLQKYEISATLTAEGAPAAKKLLERNSGLLRDASAAPIVARICWETQEPARAITLLQDYVRSQPAAYAEFAQLAEWQNAAKQPADAVQTARRAVEKFPLDPVPRVLLIEMLLAESPGATAGQEAITAYMREFAGKPDALAALAVLGGRKGWAEFNRTLYEIGASRQADLKPLALSYCDALSREARYSEIRQILTQLEAQTPEENPAFMVQLRQRQIIASAALIDSDNVREYARRLASLLSRDPDAIEICRRMFRRLGIPDAVAEMTSRSSTASGVPAAKTATARK